MKFSVCNKGRRPIFCLRESFLVGLNYPFKPQGNKVSNPKSVKTLEIQIDTKQADT